MALLPLFDPVCCQEESLELEEERTGPLSPDHLLEDWAAVAEEEWVEALCSLATREGETRLPDGRGEHTYLLSARMEAVEWVARAAERHLFSALTALLAVDYLDRCFLTSSAAGGLRLQQDKPWMGRLAAVACLSLAAKVEETRVPLLLDLHLSLAAATATEPEDNKFVFEAKSIRLMERLVLSSLGWRMNPVTPLSFIHHLLPRLCPCSKDKNAISTTTAAARVRDLVNGCEAILLCVIADRKWVRYPASVWAAAALSAASLESHETHHLISFLKVPKVGFFSHVWFPINCSVVIICSPMEVIHLQDKVDECYQLIMERGIHGGKRKHSSASSYDDYSSPPSPSESSSSGGDCWSRWPTSGSPSPEIRPLKRPNCSSGGKTFGDNGLCSCSNVNRL
ncbi:hypothetical protein C4D60_Mb07t11980 [Musa balbisiana]|uniref:Cyclin-like domain-containing protein n=1 Tax=Musa balbisiana TaxID=52838 RepID=A0A4S8JH71_MUSBA|nr:hypothetical protein C4D60_Mb07t11980 [Musa balbisiana]